MNVICCVEVARRYFGKKLGQRVMYGYVMTMAMRQASVNHIKHPDDTEGCLIETGRKKQRKRKLNVPLRGDRQKRKS